MTDVDDWSDPADDGREPDGGDYEEARDAEQYEDHCEEVHDGKGCDCAWRPGHGGRHRSVPAMERARRRGAARQPPSGSLVVAAKIRAARRRAGMSQRRLAAVVGVTETAVQHWEYAKRVPGPGSWVQIELALGPLGIVRDQSDPRPGTAAGESNAA